MQKYYALQHYDDTKHMLASTGHDTDSIKNQVTLDDYNYINKLSDKERTKIEKDFKNLKKEGYDTESLYKWYERDRDAEKAAETTRTSTEYADEHPVLGSIASVGARLGGAVPDAVKYISTDLNKKYNGGDGYINPEATNTAISDAMRAKVSENINNDFGSFLYNTGMSMADFASLLPLNAVPGGQALSLGIMGTSAGVGAANEVINNGGTIDNAVKTGIASGIAETLFEKVSLEQLSAFKASGKSTFRAAVGNVLKGAFTEGSEEAFTDLANRLTDDAINKDLSSYNLAKKNYMEQGMNEAEAENAASWDFWKMSDLILPEVQSAVVCLTLLQRELILQVQKLIWHKTKRATHKSVKLLWPMKTLTLIYSLGKVLQLTKTIEHTTMLTKCRNSLKPITREKSVPEMSATLCILSTERLPKIPSL